MKAKPIDFLKTEKIAYEEFKAEIGSATVQQICRKNAESWRSFFSHLRNKRNGELPKWLKPKTAKLHQGRWRNRPQE
ncbi:transposase [Thermococcus stetteri]|nr:transposase [Thermococcus stetteri]